MWGWKWGWGWHLLRNRGSSRWSGNLRLGHVVNRHCILGNDFSHLVNFTLQVGDIVVISFNRVFRFIILLL